MSIRLVSSAHPLCIEGCFFILQDTKIKVEKARTDDNDAEVSIA